jgi:RNA recognition motif-containing protein
MNNILYVSNFARSTSEHELINLFSQVAEVTSLRIMLDVPSGESKQYGFVTMTAQSKADRAVNRFDNYRLGQSRPRVSITRPKLRTSAPALLFEP